MPRALPRIVPLALALVACGAPAPTSPSPAASSAPADVPPPPASSSAKTAEPPPKEKPAPLFHAVAHVPEATRVFAAKGGVVVSAVLPDDVDRSFGTVDGDKLEFPPRLKLTGAGTFNSVLDVRGKLPDGLELFVVGSNGRVGRAERYSAGPKGWKPFADEGSVFAGVAETDEALVAVFQPAVPFGFVAGKIRTLRGKQPARKLRELDAKACADALKLAGDDRKAMIQQARGATMRPVGVALTAGGTLLVVGAGCTGPVVETFAKDATSGETTALPLADDALGGDGFVPFLAHPTKEEAWLAVGGTLLHWDGKSFAKEKDAPAMDEIGIAHDGTLWGLAAGGTVLWKATPEGFVKQPLPEGVKSIDSFAVAEDGTVWLVGGDTLFRTKRTGDGAPTVAPKDSAKPAPKGPLAAGGPRCKQNMVLLYGFTKVTPEDFDFPKTREAVAGHGELEGTKLVVTKENGKKYFTALVPSYDVAKKMAALVESKVPGSKPAILCTDKAPPEIVREVKIDWKTGKVLPQN